MDSARCVGRRNGDVYLGSRNLDQVQAVVLKVPFVSPSMFLKTGASFQHNGIWALVKSPGNGIPYKVYCVEASRCSWR